MRRLFTIVFSAALLLALGSAQGTWAQNNKVWELGTYPGGTWVTTWHINDLNVIAGLGDVDGSGYTHTLAVPLFGPTAGNGPTLAHCLASSPSGVKSRLTDLGHRTGGQWLHRIGRAHARCGLDQGNRHG